MGKYLIYFNEGTASKKYIDDIYRDSVSDSKDIGDAIGVSSRTVSGAMRKLVTDGYVEKIGQDPTVYCITEAGIAVNLDEA